MNLLWGRPWAWVRWRLVLAWTGGVAAVVALAVFGYMEAVKGAWIKYNQWDRRERGTLRVGQQAPDLELPLLEGGTTRLSELWLARPLVIVFGSCT